jgi:integrase/recombinase XerD
LNRIVKRLGKKAGVKVYAHLVRHSFARSFVVQGGNVATLQALLGHSSLEVTNRYVALNFADLAEHHGLHSPFRAVQEAAKNRKC